MRGGRQGAYQGCCVRRVDNLREEARPGAKGKHPRRQRSARGTATDVNTQTQGPKGECEGDGCSFLRAFRLKSGSLFARRFACDRQAASELMRVH